MHGAPRWPDDLATERPGSWKCRWLQPPWTLARTPLAYSTGSPTIKGREEVAYSAQQIYFALPGAGITLPAELAATVGLAAVYAAYLSEVFRAGLEAIPVGQREAALAGGLTPFQTFRLILLPQAIRHTVAPLLINLVSLLKDSSIAALIAVPELTLVSREIMSESFLPLQVFALTALLYFCLAWPASLAARYIEWRLRFPETKRKSLAPVDRLTTATASS